MLARVGYPLLITYAVGITWLLGQGLDTMSLALLAGVVSGSCTTIVAIWEWFAPAYEDWASADDETVSDLALTLGVLPVLVVVGEWTWRLLLPALDTPWPTHWPSLVQMVLGLLMCELSYYCFHVGCHTTDPLWRLHVVHHASKRVWWGNSGRFHPIDAQIGFLLYFLPLVIMGVPAFVCALIVVLNASTGLLEHANVEIRVGPLNRIFNTAELHRHHHTYTEGGELRNLGKVLSVWDTVFGTYHYAVEPPKRIGAEGEMAWPFRVTRGG